MALQSARNVLANPTWLSRNGGKSSGGRDQYSAVLEELRKSIPTEEDFDALYLDGKVTEYSDQETDSETDMYQASLDQLSTQAVGIRKCNNIMAHTSSVKSPDSYIPEKNIPQPVTRTNGRIQHGFKAPTGLWCEAEIICSFEAHWKRRNTEGKRIHCQTSSAIFLLSYSILLLSLCTIKEFVSSDLENGIVSSETIREEINWNKQLD
ncbi:hypothetical protein AVEN_61199-1 [Araneus ventricosus]|uniref:Uncharacterized protein n=1 Tax=Araneus ventricosus TaxID=182803 RepID=A0A4Y2JR99_ARAVE|nr:hypothetical protein AVEN_61199-1 [Araneus ventricosus]